MKFCEALSISTVARLHLSFVWSACVETDRSVCLLMYQTLLMGCVCTGISEQFRHRPVEQVYDNRTPVLSHESYCACRYWTVLNHSLFEDCIHNVRFCWRMVWILLQTVKKESKLGIEKNDEGVQSCFVHWFQSYNDLDICDVEVKLILV